MEENVIARCDAVSRMGRGDGIFYCPKSRLQYKVTASCWKIPFDYKNFEK